LGSDIGAGGTGVGSLAFTGAGAEEAGAPLQPQSEPQLSLQPQEGSQQQLGSAQQLGSQQSPQPRFLPNSRSSKQQLCFLQQVSPQLSQPQDGSAQQLGSSQQPLLPQPQLGSAQQLGSQQSPQPRFLPNRRSSKQQLCFLQQVSPQLSQPQDGSAQHDGSSQQQDGSQHPPHPRPDILSSSPPPKVGPAIEMLSTSAPKRFHFILKTPSTTGLPMVLFLAN
jgi:hypothetical protein